MGETENDKQNLDGSEQEVDEETTTSENKSGEDNDTEEGVDTDDNNDEGSDDEEETDEDEEETDDKKSKKSTSEDDKKKEDDEKEPPTRKRPSDYARERIERKNSKNGKGKDSKASDTDEDDEDDIDPEDEKTVGKVVAKALKPFIEKEARAQDDQEIKDFLSANPDFKSYEAKARKYMSHPSRKDVPIEEIFYGVAGKDLLVIGAKRAKTANKEAKKTASAGGSADAGGVKSNSELSGKEFEDKQAEVRARIADKY